MPFLVKFNGGATTQQAQAIPDATPGNDGVMTAAQAAKLASLSGGGSFQIRVYQPAMGTDFIVLFPLSLVQPNAKYAIVPTIATANLFTGISIPYVDQTPTQFRVTTDGTLPDGTLLNFVVQTLSV